MKPDKQRQNGDVDMTESEPALLAEEDPNRQEDLTTENTPDPLEGEQTWPTEEEIAEATATAGRWPPCRRGNPSIRMSRYCY